MNTSLSSSRTFSLRSTRAQFSPIGNRFVRLSSGVSPSGALAPTKTSAGVRPVFAGDSATSASLRWWTPSALDRWERPLTRHHE